MKKFTIFDLQFTILVVAILALVAMGGGCVSTGGQACPAKNCPPEDVVFMVPSPFGPQPTKMKKGFLDPEKEGQNWITLEEYNKRMKEMEAPQREKKPDSDEKI